MKLNVTIIKIAFLWLLIYTDKYAMAQQKIKTDVLVVGGGASGVCAAIQAARMGAKVVLVEETTWLGGMMTAAGVSAFDGNHNMPSGLFGEFRKQLYTVYGGPTKVETGWVSNTQFEPHIGDSIWKAMVNKEKNITVFYEYKHNSVMVKEHTVDGVIFKQLTKGKKALCVLAKQTIDATELGSVMALANVPYSIGMEASSETGEDVKIPLTNTILQDLTYCAILKDYGAGTDKTITKPANYNPIEFDGCNNEYASSPEKILSNISARTMLDYAKLPNNKYLINWPNKGNDTYAQYLDIKKDSDIKAIHIKKAKEKTLRFIYFIQTQLGFKNLGLADDEFPTEDKLPLIPYYRESRRLQGMVRMNVQHISKPFENNDFKTGIAVGDYPIDHHHREVPSIPKDLGFYPIPSYSIPMGCLIPKKMKGLIVAEKSISVSNVVNGTTRLQPVVMQIGQAAGALAALCVQNEVHAQKVSVRAVQLALLKNKAYIMPYYDVPSDHPYWESIQKIGATGIIKGEGEPYKWANRTWFYPDSAFGGSQATNNLCAALELQPNGSHPPDNKWTLKELRSFLNYLVNTKKLNAQFVINENSWALFGLKNYDETRPITRAELAVLLDKTINPFENTKFR
jgi:hypothetical protein